MHRPEKILAAYAVFCLFAQLACLATSEASPAIQRETRDIAGWKVHIARDLLVNQREKTERALELLKQMLDEIKRVAPASAVTELQQVPLYFSTAYGKRSRAEFHPDAQWLRNHGRDPVMAECIEFSGVEDFEAEVQRMPNFALHELAHAFHFHVIQDGFKNEEIIATFERARASGKYDRVERHHGLRKPATTERAYAMTSAMEYFAETSEAFFSRNDFYPFTREELKEQDPQMFELLTRLWNLPETK